MRPDRRHVSSKEFTMHAADPLDCAMVFFDVREMTCRRSAAAVRDALRELDRGAEVRIDLPMRRVEIQPIRAEPCDFRDAIRNAGYTPTRQWPSELLQSSF
jgi:copper chaperone CopZ